MKQSASRAVCAELSTITMELVSIVTVISAMNLKKQKAWIVVTHDTFAQKEQLTN